MGIGAVGKVRSFLGEDSQFLGVDAQVFLRRFANFPTGVVVRKWWGERGIGDGCGDEAQRCAGFFACGVRGVRADDQVIVFF